MKTTFSKLLAVLLVLASFVSLFGIFAFAEEEGTETEDDTVYAPYVYVNRNYEEGWDFDNGGHNSLVSNPAVVLSELDENLKTNHFVRITGANANDAFLKFDFSDTPSTGVMVIDISLRVTDNYALGGILTQTAASGSGGSNTLVSVTESAFVVPGGKVDFDKEKPDQWVDFTFIIDFNLSKFHTQTGDSVKTGYQVYANGEMITEGTTGTIGAGYLKLGLPAGNGKIGYSIDFDNLRVYRFDWIPEKETDARPKNVRSLTPAEIREIYPDTTSKSNESYYGVLVSLNADKPIKVVDDGTITKDEAIANALMMKVGSSARLNAGTKETSFKTATGGKDIFGKPVVIDGIVFAPVDPIISKAGYTKYYRSECTALDIARDNGIVYLTAGRDRATVDGEMVDLCAAPIVAGEGEDAYMLIAIDDVNKIFDGWYATYDELGLIVISQLPDVVNRAEDLAVMCDAMSKFLFDYPAADTIYNDVKNGTSEFTHPYLVCGQETFNNLRTAYAGSGELADWLKTLVAEADALVTKYDTAELPKAPANYTAAGRYAVQAAANEVLTLAFAYQVTENEDYLALAYDLMVNLAGWQHWGPGSAIDCADATAAYAIAYDWLYNALVAGSYNLTTVEEGLFNNGVNAGHLAAVKETCYFKVSPTSETYLFANKKNYTNVEASSGYLIGALALIGNEAYKDICEELAANILTNLPKNGLTIYAPDGSLVDGPSAWNTATNELFLMASCLISATGDDYGILDAAGVNTTCDFAIAIENDGTGCWNYHDSTAEPMDTKMFGFYAAFSGNNNYFAARKDDVANGKPVSMFDCIFYVDGDLTEIKPALDAKLDGITSFVTRSDWTNGAIYAGIHGGSNNVEFGDIDAGNFMYAARGIVFAEDLGTDNPGLFGYNTDLHRYHYYKKGVEGQNVVFLSHDAATKTIKYGQNTENGNSPIYAWGTNDYGAFALIDNATAYNSLDPNEFSFVSFARRGMMLTNSRQTAVFQDEISLKSVGSFVWVMHTAQDVVIDQSGRIAYFTAEDANGETVTVRGSIVTPSKEFKFEAMPADDDSLVLASTYTVDEAAALLATQQQHDRSTHTILTVKADAVLSFEFSIVFEVIDPENPTEVAYEYTAMDNWTPYSAEEWAEAHAGTAEKDRTNVKMPLLKTAILEADAYVANATEMEDDRLAYYLALTDAYVVCEKYSNDDLKEGEYPQYKERYLSYLADYDKEVKRENSYVESIRAISELLMGMTEAEAEEDY